MIQIGLNISSINEAQYNEYVERQFERLLDEFEPNFSVSTAVSKGLAPALVILRYIERNPVGTVVIGESGTLASGRLEEEWTQVDAEAWWKRHRLLSSHEFHRE